MKNRKGKFCITGEMIAEERYAEAMSLVFASVQIVKAEYNVFEDRFEYQAYSRHFDKIELGQVIPEYTVEIKSTYETLPFDGYHVMGSVCFELNGWKRK